MERKQIDQERRAEIGRERRTRTRARIVAAAFEVFGDEAGLYAGIEHVAERAALTRATVYNHFSSMAELREALTFEVTHDFLEAVTNTISKMPDARDRSACAVRFYLRRAQADRRWAWSMINLSATGFIFGAETFRQAEQTVREGVDDGVFPLPSVELGRDLLLGTTLAAMGSIVRGGPAENYPEMVAAYILFGLGVPLEETRICANQVLPQLDKPE
ncbi:MAG TPA: helix-turn-helix domain-containing protein [Sphingobium sp.]